MAKMVSLDWAVLAQCGLWEGRLEICMGQLETCLQLGDASPLCSA